MDEMEEEKPYRDIDRETLEGLIDRKDAQGIRKLFESVQNIDIAEASEGIDVTKIIYVFRVVPPSLSATYFDSLSQETKEGLIDAMTDKELVKIINEQSADDVADFIDEMPANLSQRVLKAASKDMREDVNGLLHYKDGTAGAIMTTEYLEFEEKMDVEEAIDTIRKIGKEAETIYTIFVRNPKRDFLGTIDIDDLIFSKKDATLGSIVHKDSVSVSTSTDQEDVAKIFRRYDLHALAVLNEDRKLVGIITVDDALDVFAMESQEDLARMSAMSPAEKPYMETSSFQNARNCIPWLVVLLILGTFTTLILNRLENQKIFISIAVLTAFIPMLMGTGGNAGSQTTGLMIRALAVDEITPKDIGKVLWKEARTALIVSIFVAVFCFVWVSLELYVGIVDLGDLSGTGDLENPLNFTGANAWNGRAWTGEFAVHAFTFAGLVAVTAGLAIFAAKIIGTLLPLGAAAIKKDPALLSQPLLTTVMDTATLLIYFGVACAFFPMYA